MNNKLFVILVTVFVLTNIVRLIYELLKYRKRLVPNTNSYIVILIDMILMFVLWYILCGIDNSVIYFPEIIRLSGLLLFLLGIVLVIIARVKLKTFEIKPGGELITNGIYSKLRHPMYLGFLLWAIGLPVYYGVLYSLILAIPFSANILFWRYIEEKELLERIPEYKIYKEKTVF